MSKPSWLSNRLIIVLVWVVAIAVRIYGATTPAQYYDIGTYEAWSRTFWVHGPMSFFSSVWSDYLPLPILTFAPISLIADFFQAPFGLIFKLIHIALELVLIAVLPGIGILPKALLLLSPAIIGDTSFWGQVDTIPALLALLSLCIIIKAKSINTFRSTIFSSVVLGLAVAYKPIMILIAPILWIIEIKKGYWWQLPVISMVIFFATAIPTGGINFIPHIFERILGQADTYPYLSINAFNFWSLVPINTWSSDSTTVLNISGRNLGFLIFGILSLITLNYWRLTRFLPKFAPRVAATILILFYTFTTRMHERHLLFGLPFLTLAAFIESWMLLPLALLTATFTLNLYGAYYWVNNAQSWPFSYTVISITSWVTVITALVLSVVWNWQNFFSKFKNMISKNKLLIAILVLASILRFGNLSYPDSYIFDEVYHAYTSKEYLHNHIEAWEWWTTPPKGVAYEWTHPPVAKYGMVVGMLLFGENSFGWRFGSALMGVLSILGIYFIVSSLTKNRTMALLSAFFVSIEGLHIAQSRLAMNDSYMLCFYIWALYLAIKSRWKYAAILYGLSLASKWSALYGVIPLAFIYIHDNLSKIKDLKSIIYYFFYIIRLLLIVVAVYVLSFAPFILAGHSWEQWWELHRQMWYYHTNLVATHAYQSTPLQWLFGARPVWYYVKYLDKTISNIYAQSNPLILWLGLTAIIFQVKKLFQYPFTLFMLLYLIFTLPWIFSPRIMFFYHYLPSSVFLCVILASWVSELPRRWQASIIVCCLLGLLFIVPMLFGFPMSHGYWDTLYKIFPSWK